MVQKILIPDFPPSFYLLNPALKLSKNIAIAKDFVLEVEKNILMNFKG